MIPAPWVVGVRRWSQDGPVDAHGNTGWGHGDPVPVPVHAVGPRVQEEPGDPRRWVVVDGLTVYAPAGTVVAAEDVVLWPVALRADGTLDASAAVEYQVTGPVADWTRGPWVNPVAGVTFDLETVKG